MESWSQGVELHVGFSKDDRGGKLDRLFIDTGVVRILESYEYEAVYMVSPILGPISDCICGTKSGSITNSFMECVFIREHCVQLEETLCSPMKIWKHFVKM